jgi:predicted ATPase/class 3 adenylate cyclase
LRVDLLGPFCVRLGERTAGPWPRPVAKRLCGLVLVSPGRRVSRVAACEALFPQLAAHEAARGLSKALSMANAALSGLGDPGRALLQADRMHIWADPPIPLEVDVEVQEDTLSSALDAEAGLERDELLALAVRDDRTLLEDEVYADWAVRPRERLDWLRQEARLALARDRAKGFGRCGPADVAAAWEACLAHDATSEEAASALMRLYAAQRKPALVEASFQRCRSALEQLGLRISPASQEVHGATTSASVSQAIPESPRVGTPAYRREERKLVSVIFLELSGPAGFQKVDPEDLRELVGGAVAALISEVEALGGTVTSVSGAGVAALFGAPESHEDDPERAVRAGYRMLSAPVAPLTVRAGVETGQAVVGPIGKGASAGYGAVGEVVGAAAALQSVARPGSVLVGPVTHAATSGLFEWGPTEGVATSMGAKPLVACYVERPKARPSGEVARRPLAQSAPLMGREAEISVLRHTLREATAGKGAVVLIAGEPGLGKTRLVHECRKLFMAWVGAASGRLPLWLEGKAASYASSRPYGLYKQLLTAWVGAAPEEGEEVARPAFERAMRAVFGANADEAQVSLLAQVMGLGPGKAMPTLAGLSPEQLQRATFEALKALVSRLVSYGPIVTVLEDLHWADPTSLRLIEELSSLTNEGPLLLVLTRRPEPDPGVSALEAALVRAPELSLRKLELAPLAQSAERDLARALLGEGAPDEVVEGVSQGAEGNPFFLEERLSSLLETHALVRGEGGAWCLERTAPGELPEAVERLVRARVDRLAPGPHDAIVAASVLGPEFALGALGTVTDLDGGLLPAVSDLCSAGLLVELRKLPEPLYRFRHALIQEATYKGLLRDQRRDLHARAAWGLEEAAAGRLEESAGVLGHHYAMAGEVDRAVHYLELAGDQAAKAFANDEAISSYRYGLALLDRDSRAASGHDVFEATKAATALRIKLGQVLLQTGRHAEARQALQEGLTVVGWRDRSQSARLQALLGRVETADHDYAAAMAAFQAAIELIGEHPEQQDQALVDLWLEVQLDGLGYLHYWRNEPAKAAAMLSAVRPVVLARGTTARRQMFYSMFALQRARESRYRIDEETLTNLRAALATAEEGDRQQDIALMSFGLGFGLLWYGDLAEAQQRMAASLAMVERTGDLVLRARCLCYLNVTALRSGDAEAVRSLAPEVMAAAEAASYPEYVAAAKATMAWVAWRDERLEDVVRLAHEALELWRSTVVSYSWYWLCLWPLVAVRLRQGQLAEAVEAARQLLPPPQQRLPDELEAEVQDAVGAWEKGERKLAKERLSNAVELAKQLRYA